MVNSFVSSKIVAETSINMLCTKTEILSDLESLPISDNSAQRTYLVRHGESTANVYFEINGKKVRYVSGQSTNVSLTDLGNEQIRGLAKKLAARLPLKTPLVIVSSTALRTQQTAKILFEELSKTHSNVVLAEESYKELNERSLGEWEGQIRDEKYEKAEEGWRKKSAVEKFKSPEVEGAETNSEVATRALSAMEEIFKKYEGSTVLAITSFNTINACAIKINNLDGKLSTAEGTNLPKLNLGNGDLVLLEAIKNKGIQVVSHIKNEALVSH